MGLESGRGLLRFQYITLDPFRYPRVRKIASTFKEVEDIKFEVFLPRIRVTKNNFILRMGAAIINYFVIFFQLLFTDSSLFWLANCPDILVLPLILRSKDYILDYRSPWPIEIEREFGDGPWLSIAEFFERISIRSAKIITLTTNKLRERITVSTPIFVVPNYPTMNFLIKDFSVKDFKLNNNCAKDERVILFIGRLSEVEGADILPSIIRSLTSLKQDICFWIVGDGPLFPLLQKIFKNNKKVRLFGWRNRSEIPYFIKSSDICIAPRHENPHSKYYNEEGLQKISEYMFYNKPIVACGISESDEYLLVKREDMVQGILEALNGNAPTPRRKTWEEESSKILLKMIKFLKRRP
jgi:glycosyltransferase involved in cell wall biosynthesis